MRGGTVGRTYKQRKEVEKLSMAGTAPVRERRVTVKEMGSPEVSAVIMLAG